MTTFRQRFLGAIAEDFPEPPLARRLEPGDVVEYEADQPIVHARLELVPPPKTSKAAAPASTDKED